MACLNRIASVCALAFLASCSQGMEQEAQTVGADLVLRGGSIYTMNPAQPWAEAIAVREGRIAQVGTNAEVDGQIGAETERIELRGRMVLPGIHDAHVHPSLGEYFHHRLCQTYGASIDELASAIESCAARASDDRVVGYGWTLTRFGSIEPHRSFLDALVSDRPVVLLSDDMHTFWVNSFALSHLGYGPDSPDPPGGTIVERAELGDEPRIIEELDPTAVDGRQE